jgi:signal transduction histidine kinase
VVAAAIAAGVLLVVGLALVTAVRRELYENLDRSLDQRAADVDTATRAESTPVIMTSDPEDHFAQVLDASGRLIAATGNAEDLDTAWPLPDAGTTTFTTDSLPIEDDAYRVLVRVSDDGGVRRYTVVGENIDDLRDTIRTLVATLAILFPVALAALAAAVWWLVGRTLRPVDDIRAEVDAIGLQQLDRRVPAPGTGDEVDRLAATMNEMLDRLEVAAAQQRRFVADASHELRTPLTRMRTQLEVDLRSGVVDHERTLRSVLDDTVEMQQLVDDLLFLARRDAIGAGAGVVPAMTVDLDVLALDEARAVRDESTVEIDTSGVGAAAVPGSESDLRRLLRNLLTNAVRHATGRVTVSLREEGSHAVLTVEDDGPGIPAVDRDRVFERFVRLDEARGGGGSGLGLAIVREIAVAHAGTVRVGGAELGGAAIVVTLPLDGD